MSTITRGVIAGVLLAGAVAGAAAFPRFLAGPAATQTPSFSVLPAASPPAIVRAPALLAPAPKRHRLAVVAAAVVPVRSLPPAAPAPTPIVVHPVPKPVRVEPKPAPTKPPTPPPVTIHPPAPAPPPAAPAPAQAVAAQSSAQPVRLAASAAPPPPPPAAPTPAAPATSVPSYNEQQDGDGHHGGSCNGGLGSGDHGAAPQAPSSPVGYGSGPVGRVEAPYTQAATSDHGHGPASWAYGGGKGH